MGPTDRPCLAAGAFLSGLLQELHVNVEGVEIVSDNARTKRIHRPMHHDTTQQRAKCRWSNIVDDVTKSPSSSTSSSSRKQFHLQQQQSRSPSSRKRSSSQRGSTALRWDDVVVDKQNLNTSSINSCLRNLAYDCRLDDSLPDLAPSSPSTSTSSRKSNLPRGGPLLPPTRQISLESEKGRKMDEEEDADDETSVDLEKEHERLREKRADKPLLVPKRSGFLNKPQRSNSISESSVISVMSKKQLSWNERHSPRRHQRPGLTKANSMSYIHGAGGERRHDNASALLRLVKRVDRIMLEDSFPKGTVSCQLIGTHESSSTIDSLIADTIPSLPIRRTSLEKDKSHMKKRKGKKQTQQPRSSKLSMLSATVSNNHLMDPFAHNDCSDSSLQPQLLRAVDARSPTPPPTGKISTNDQHNGSSSSMAEVAAAALKEALDIATYPIHMSGCSLDKDDDSSCSLSVCSDIYSDVED